MNAIVEWAFLLWLLAGLDAAFTGFRDAAGRDPRIAKASFYRRALLRGFLHGQALSLLAGAWVAITLALAPDSSALWSEYLSGAGRLLQVYLPYAALVLLALVAYLALPSLDHRVLADVSILGPFTLGRPLVILAGPVWLHASGSWAWQVALLAWVSALGLVLLQPFLGRRWPRRPLPHA